MTILAFDGVNLAADRLTSFDALRGTRTKIHRVGSLLMGGSGNTSKIDLMHEWFRNGAKPENFPTENADESTCCNFMVIDATGQISHYTSTHIPIKVEEKQWAVGSGRDYALAAMHLGYGARRAVEVACFFDPGCGNGVDVLALHE